MSTDINQDRLRLREKNELAWSGEVYVPSGKLDSSLKKNSAFTKKLKSVSAENYKNALKDIETLSLEKYLSEVAISIEEIALKVSKSDDIMAFMEIVSLLHRRFPGQITSPLLSILVNCVVNLEEGEPILRVRNALRLLFEMYLCGLGSTFSQCTRETLSARAILFYNKFRENVMIVPLLKDVMSCKGSFGYTFPATTLFLKRFLPVLQNENDLVPEELQKEILNVFTTYTTTMIDSFVKQHTANMDIQKKNKEVSIRTGRVIDSLQEAKERGIEEENLIAANLEVFCLALNIEMPQLTKPEEKPECNVVVVNDNTAVWWEDAKERSLYKDIPDLSQIVLDSSIEGLPESELANLRDAEKVVVFIQHLEDVNSEHGVNVLVKSYMTQMPHNKATSNRILRFFMELPKVDSISYYARYLRITSLLYPEIITELIERLDQSFRAQIHHGSINFRSLYLFVELIKFDLIPTHVVFHKIHKMTMNIAGTNNADILLIFYERCGKFLLLEPKYQKTTQEMLQLLAIQAKSDKLSITEKLALRNMFLIVSSFTAKSVETQKISDRSPQQDFVVQLLRRVSVPGKHIEVAKIIKTYISDRTIQDTVLEVYRHPEELPLDRFDCLTSVLRIIGNQQKFIICRICDTLEEQVIRGLELDDYRQNVSRMAQIKLLAAFCNQKVLSFESGLQLMFKIICFGHANNLPLPNSELAIDMPDDYFRILLVCTFLKAVKMHHVAKAKVFQHGPKSMEGLLVFLQYYILCKKQPLPMDVLFLVEDAYKAYEKQAMAPFTRATDVPSALMMLQKYIVSSQQEADDSAQQEVAELLESDDEEEWEGDSDSSLSEEDSDDEVDDSVDIEYASGSESESESESELDFEDELDSEEERERLEELEALELERKHAQSLDNGIRELMKETSGRSGIPFKVPAPSTFVSGSKRGPMNFSLLGRNNTLREVPLQLDGESAERIKREQDAQKANREKILSLINNMDS